MRQLTNFGSNGTQLLAEIRKVNRNNTNYVSTTLVSGTFGGGTLSMFLSPDNGVTLVPLSATPGGSQTTFTTAGSMFCSFGNGATNTDTLKLYGTLSGATSPNLNVFNYDNNG